MPAVRGRILLAVMVSLALHGAFVLSWLRIHERRSPAWASENTEVDAPDDREMVINLREPLPRTKQFVGPERKADATPPALLAPSIVAIRGPGPVIPTGDVAQPSNSLPSKPLGIPLHGKLKAGKSIVYLLDRSSSMGPDGLLQKACDSIKASLGQLNAECRFQIVAYNGGVDHLDSRLLLATIENRERAEHWLDSLVAEGASQHVRGIREALSFHSDAVFLLTDADDLDEKEARAIRALLRDPVYLTAAVFGSKPSKRDTPLERLTHDMGGSVKYVGR